MSHGLTFSARELKQAITFAYLTAGILEHLVKTGTPIAALAARNARIAVLLDNLPAATHGNLAQLPHLIFVMMSSSGRNTGSGTWSRERANWRRHHAWNQKP
jgi:hypothetical protein